jgi:hypothetical protein
LSLLPKAINMSPNPTIDHHTLRGLVTAGSIRAASVVGQATGWGIVVHYGTVACPLAAQRGGVRTFRKLDTVMDYLRTMGIPRFEVDAANFDPQTSKASRTRPDSASKLKRVHDIAAHDAWFREQVALGLAGLEAGQALTEAEHQAHRAKRRAALLERAERQAANSEHVA